MLENLPELQAKKKKNILRGLYPYIQYVMVPFSETSTTRAVSNDGNMSIIMYLFALYLSYCSLVWSCLEMHEKCTLSSCSHYLSLWSDHIL